MNKEEPQEYKKLYSLASEPYKAKESWTIIEEFKLADFELVRVAGFEPALSPPQTE